MTREQIEIILKGAQAKADKDGGYVLPDGANVTIHVAHDGAMLGLQKVENIRFEGELLHAKSTKQSVSIVTSDVFAIVVEGASGTTARRPAGFL